ncbi:hypothetical protein [Phenylobacterium sp.]|uniref:hypothetical protein n=1 Tax=Phenylobacterium sp. TaxID=1871053 RepID=UPI0025CE4862|nr:hypothetical protein [Phenylobacterium sp.]MBX3481975.1 hypothetical protein [Phenylobacterium sp.]MCW5758347.1 hypothetical protein [Phenylobacterium sp.]
MKQAAKRHAFATPTLVIPLGAAQELSARAIPGAAASAKMFGGTEFMQRLGGFRWLRCQRRKRVRYSTLWETRSRMVRNGEFVDYSVTPIYGREALPPRFVMMTARGSNGSQMARIVENPAGRPR